MMNDKSYPNFLVQKGRRILHDLCGRIEKDKPDAAAVLVLCHAATESFNSLAQEFNENESEIETVARECIGGEFDTILKAYGFEIDVEEAMSPRDW